MLYHGIERKGVILFNYQYRIEWGNNKVSKLLQYLMSNSNPSNNFNSGFEFGLDSRTEGVTDEKANGAPG